MMRVGPALLVAFALLAGDVAARPGGGVVRVEHRDPATMPTRGPANAPVTIELFFVPAVNPSTRGIAYRNLEALQAKHPARIRLVYRVMRGGAHGLLPITALEAHAQGKFAELMVALGERQSGALGREAVLALARDIGMDAARLSAALSEGRYAEVFAENDRRAQRMRAGGAPAVLFNSKVPQKQLTSLSEADLENEYQQAYKRAMELIDQGYAPSDLPAAFDREVLRSDPPLVFAAGRADDEGEDDGLDHRLLDPPLPFAGMPAFGNLDGTAEVPVLVLCKPYGGSCQNMLSSLRRLQETYHDEVRVIWAPWFDVVLREDAADQSLLGDAALCAEQIGSSPDELDASPGWRWIVRQYEHQRRAQARKIPPERLIDMVSRDLDVDSKRLSACRARTAGATLEWIARARQSGIERDPAIVIGGRIYEGVSDPTQLQQLVEAELAPGILGGSSESQFERLLFFLGARGAK